MQPLTSAITGALSEAQRALSSTGQRRGDGGSGQLATEEDFRAWLVAHRPEETDRILQASLMSSLGVEVRLVTELRFPVAGGYYEVVVGSKLHGNRDNKAAAYRRVEAAMTPPTRDQADEWLAMLQIATAGAKKSHATQSLALDLYSGALTRYPADVAKDACKRLATTERWFPVLADLIYICDELSARRRHMLAALS